MLDLFDFILCLHLISFQLSLKIALKPCFLFVAVILQHSNNGDTNSCKLEVHIIIAAIRFLKYCTEMEL